MLWRSAGLTYIRYSQIAAQVTRDCKKVAAGVKERPQPTINITVWENGKPKKLE